MKEILKKYISSLPANEYALFLSGGMDSILILICLLELNKKVTAYTFSKAGPRATKSTDWNRARFICDKLDIDFNSVSLYMEDKDTLLSQLKILKELGCKKKTEFECVYPFYISGPYIREKYILTGHCGDTCFCISKKGMIHYKDNRIEDFRDEQLAKPLQYHILKPMFKTLWDKELPMYPFAIPEIREWFRGKSWDDCNKPKQKQLIINEIESSHIKIGIPLVKHQNLQMGDSGIAEGFNILLEGTEFLNPIAIYNRL